ncbi:MAG: ADP-ribosylglycohydrolase family protein, partial [Desulfobacteraceae bacterium]|nr:ADP-ribosylglycohydrolase family protein [Desulfobacteraceae bacterium]
STGSITGNILGAFLGIDSIPPMYSDNLELLEAIKEMAYDLFDRI